MRSDGRIRGGGGDFAAGGGGVVREWSARTISDLAFPGTEGAGATDGKFSWVGA